MERETKQIDCLTTYLKTVSSERNDLAPSTLEAFTYKAIHICAVSVQQLCLMSAQCPT